MEFFPFKKALQVFGQTADSLQAKGIQEGDLPHFARSATDHRLLKSWSSQQMPALGEVIGFLKRPKSPVAVAVFVTKGGVLKSTLTLNLARIAALHGIRTCVVGLDMQGDITTALSQEMGDDDLRAGAGIDTSSDGRSEEVFADAIRRLDALRGLSSLFSGEAKLEDLICSTDLPTLSYLPETPELVALDQSLIQRNRREYWLSENVIEPLKKRFDLIFMDCSPNWNRLITNALVGCDVLISPLECKINNFRNFKAFRALLTEFQTDMRTDFKQIYVPTRLNAGRKLSREIFNWYRETLSDCTSIAVRESQQGEEASALKTTIIEHAPTSAAADEIRQLSVEIWAHLIGEPASIDKKTVMDRVARRDTDLSL